jgi:hypothetical protein
MTTLTIRQATPEDATALARLLDQFDGLGVTPEQVAARMRACQNVVTTFLAEMVGQPGNYSHFSERCYTGGYDA